VARVIGTLEHLQEPLADANATLGLRTGMTHMERFARPDGRIAIPEVAARPPGAQFTTLLSAAHDVDFYALWARLAIHGRFEAPQRRYAAGAGYVVFRHESTGRIEQALRRTVELVRVRLDQGL
jgi:hypothetical protein